MEKTLCYITYARVLKSCQNETLLKLIGFGLDRGWLSYSDAETLLKEKGGRFSRLNLRTLVVLYQPLGWRTQNKTKHSFVIEKEIKNKRQDPKPL